MSPSDVAPGHGRPPARQALLEVWPEKVLWASMLLFLIAAVGLLTGILDLTTGLGHTDQTPTVFTALSPWYVITLSLFTGLFAYMAVTQRSTGFATLAAIMGVLSIGYYGANGILAAVALGLIGRANKERHDLAHAPHLTHAKAPSRSIAAALAMLAAAVLTLLWGLAILLGLAGFTGYFVPARLFGALTILVGILGVGAARALAIGRATEMAAVIGLFIVATASLYVVGPALALIAIGLILLKRSDTPRGGHAAHV